ncbi:MAG: rhodanese-like domain-containing protein [Deltaproteobacteria bacterium]|nr:rhodanese-like domain-containing protein [Deltaproteobacteria bacterium]
MSVTVRRVSALEAKALCDEGWIFLDVRTEEEFAAGHPAGARNVPFLSAKGGALQPVPTFVDDVRRSLSESQPIVVGCAAGVRSARAAETLLAAGFGSLADLRPGYAGLRDPFGRVLEKGWLAEGLPIAIGADDGMAPSLA